MRTIKFGLIGLVVYFHLLANLEAGECKGALHFFGIRFDTNDQYGPVTKSDLNAVKVIFPRAQQLVVDAGLLWPQPFSVELFHSLPGGMLDGPGYVVGQRSMRVGFQYQFRKVKYPEFESLAVVAHEFGHGILDANLMNEFATARRVLEHLRRVGGLRSRLTEVDNQIQKVISQIIGGLREEERANASAELNRLSDVAQDRLMHYASQIDVDRREAQKDLNAKIERYYQKLKMLDVRKGSDLFSQLLELRELKQSLYKLYVAAYASFKGDLYHKIREPYDELFADLIEILVMQDPEVTHRIEVYGKDEDEKDPSLRSFTYDNRLEDSPDEPINGFWTIETQLWGLYGPMISHLPPPWYSNWLQSRHGLMDPSRSEIFRKYLGGSLQTDQVALILAAVYQTIADEIETRMRTDAYDLSAREINRRFLARLDFICKQRGLNK